MDIKFCIRNKILYAIPTEHKRNIAYMNAVLSTLIFSVNIGVAIVIRITKQLSIQSIHLTYIVCISDALFALLGLIPLTLLTLFGKDLHCTVTIICNFLVDFFIVVIASLTLLMMIDRYIHIKYLAEYAKIFTAKLYKTSLLFVAGSSTVSACASVTLCIKFSVNRGKIFIALLNGLLVVITCTVYLVSYILLKMLQRRGINLRRHTRDITEVARLYLVLTLIVRILPVVSVFIVESLDLHIPLVLGIYISRFGNTYFIFNAGIFMCINRRARAWLSKRRRKRVAPR